MAFVCTAKELSERQFLNNSYPDFHDISLTKESVDQWCRHLEIYLQLIADTLNIVFEILYDFSVNFMTQLNNTRFRINKRITVLAFWATL